MNVSNLMAYRQGLVFGEGGGGDGLQSEFTLYAELTSLHLYYLYAHLNYCNCMY